MSGRQTGKSTVLGVPLRPWTMSRTLSWICEHVAVSRQGLAEPAYLITANLNYCMLTARNSDLPAINEGAAGVVADGMPLVVWSWLSPRAESLPERVAGSQLIDELCGEAAKHGQRVYFLGGQPDVLRDAVKSLRSKHRGLIVAGAHSPPFRTLSEQEDRELVRRVRSAKPDILLVAFGQPKGERWLAKYRKALNVPVSIQLGASFDFAAGRVRRAPRWIQDSGLEWAFRLAMEPKRLWRRYARVVPRFLAGFAAQRFRQRRENYPRHEPAHI